MARPPDGNPRAPAPSLETPALAALQNRLDDYAARQPQPRGLAARVFEASAALLPRPAAPARRRPPVVPSVSRLALAASIALAFAVGLRLLPVGSARAPLPPDVERVLLEYAGAADADAATWRGAPGVEGVEHLLITRDMTFRDLAGDLAVVAADLEM